jgi:fermentation-respiration switch protein FrsA (DUF1100 family)
MSILVLLLVCFPLVQDSAPTKFVGSWEGLVKAGAQDLRIGFVLKLNDRQQLTGSMFNIGQGNIEVPIETTAIKDREVKLLFNNARAHFTGNLNQAGDAIEGHWQQGSARLPLTLKRVQTLSNANRPQTPRAPFPYQSEDVSYENTAARVTLAGTLTLPKGDGPFPAVLLITGSGPQDRDETFVGHKPFLVIADTLTRRGIAVLRVDDRGIGQSTGTFATATTFDFADDVEAGLRYLATRPEIDKHRVGLIGHSEGGIIAPLVASRNKEVAFIVLLAGLGLPGEEISCLQGRLIAKAGGMKDADLDVSERIQRKLFAVIKAEPPGTDLVQKLKQTMQTEVANLTPEQRKELNKAGGLTAAEASLAAFTRPWFKLFLTHDPVPVLRKVTCPVLALNGELDLQVSVKQNLEAIEAALKAGGNKDYTIKALPKLNHLFQTATTGAPSEYGRIDETVNTAVLQLLGDWISERAKR